jgi:pyruvate formate-lyase activating enzyme-like uncharacterized protein
LQERDVFERITPGFIRRIENPVFRRCAEEYLAIAEDYAEQVRGFGLSQSSEECLSVFDERVATLEARGVTVANDRKSLSVGWVSPSCVICRKGVETATFLISNQCTRNCFFCFNPNQANYAEFCAEKDDPAAKLAALHGQGVTYRDLALTGGEPLLHKDETAAFFRQAKALYPAAYTRLYTSGSFLDEDYLRVLSDTGLDEIRLSIKTDDSIEERAHTLRRLEQSRTYIPQVVVEMPVMPDELKLMKSLLLSLDGIGITGINLLELCFPFHNAGEFARRGYAIKKTPLRIPYNYTYAGGVPIAKSEENCLLLLEYALEQGLAMGVHYCSLENKFSGQVYMQNSPFATAYPFCAMSERDYFLKSAKVFGRDVEVVEHLLTKTGTGFPRANASCLYKDADEPSLAFPLAYVERLKEACPAMEIGVGYNIVEQSEDGPALRELRIDYTTPQAFDLLTDI